MQNPPQSRIFLQNPPLLGINSAPSPFEDTDLPIWHLISKNLPNQGKTHKMMMTFLKVQSALILLIVSDSEENSVILVLTMK